MLYQCDRGALPPVLSGMNALIVGVANERSIAWGCAQAMCLAGAEIAMTYLNDKALPPVEPLAREVEGALLLPLKVCDESQADALMSRVADRAPARRLVTIEEVGAACVFLASPYGAAMTGETLYIDGGYHILG